MIGSHDHISTTFNNELSNLNESLLEMGRILESMYEKSIIAFDQKSEVFKIFEKIAQKTVDASNKIKIKDVDISS